MSSIKFMYENDVFTAEDQYYSQGVLLEYKAAFFKKSPLTKILIQPNETHWENEYGLAVRQDVYTPKSILNKVTDRDDRPYAAVFYASQFLHAHNCLQKMRITTKLDLGLIGPLGIGEQEQKFIHKSIGDVQPIGWEDQVSNSFFVNYTCLLEKGYALTSFLEGTGSAGITAGILNTHAEAGAMLRIGKLRSYYKSRERKNGMEFYATIAGNARYIAYNGIMQGVFYTKSVHTLDYNDLEPIVYRSHIGLTLAFKRFSMSYYKYNITKEIKKGLPHAWGSLQFVGWF